MKSSTIVPCSLRSSALSSAALSSLVLIIALGLNAAPATAATITLDYESIVNGETTVSPLLALFAKIPAGKTIYTNQLYTGQFQISDAVQTQAQSGIFSAGFASLANVVKLPNSITTQNPAFLSLLTINFAGSAKITSSVGMSDVNFSFDNISKRLNVTNYTQNVLAGCLTGECTFATNAPVKWSVFGSLTKNLPSLFLIGGELSYVSRTTPVRNSLFAFRAEGPIDDESLAQPYGGNPRSMPTPAMLPGLIGMGLSAWRRKRSMACV